MSKKTKELSDILNSLPEWNRWNNYKDIFDTERITNTFIDNVLLPSKNEKILDFGAGFAMNEYFLKERGINIDSLDIDTEEVRSTFKKVHEKLNLNTYLYDGKTIPFKDNTYDKINFKASLTKMRKSDLIQVFSELLRVSKDDAIWYISPPYMLPRFVTSFAKRLLEDWNLGTDRAEILNKIASKNIAIIMNDWVKRSTFAFGSAEMMGSDIGWISENTFDFDALRTNYKFGYEKATSFFVHEYSLTSLVHTSLEAAARNIEVTATAAEMANKNFSKFKKDYQDVFERVVDNKNYALIKTAAKVSSSYPGKTYIFARGKSADLQSKEFKDRSAGKEDTVIYVNDWKKLLTRYEYSKFSENSINIHFLNRDIELNFLNSRQYFDKTFAFIQLNSEIGETEIAKKVHSMVYGSQQNLAQIPAGKIKTKVKTAGLHAVFYAVKVLKRKDIEIFGLDFFESNYLTEHVISKKPEPQEYQPAKGKIAKEQFINLVKENNNVNFIINTYADFSNVSLDNLTINQIKE